MIKIGLSIRELQFIVSLCKNECDSEGFYDIRNCIFSDNVNYKSAIACKLAGKKILEKKKGNKSNWFKLSDKGKEIIELFNEHVALPFGVFYTEFIIKELE